MKNTLIIIFCLFSITIYSQEIPEPESSIKEIYGYPSNLVLTEYILSVENNEIIKNYTRIVKFKNNKVIDTVNLEKFRHYNSLKKISSLVCQDNKKKCEKNLKKNLFITNFDFNFYKTFDVIQSKDTLIINITNPKLKKSQTKLVFNKLNQITTELHYIYSRGKIQSTYETIYTYNKKGIISEKIIINPKTRKIEKNFQYNKKGQKECLTVYKDNIEFSKIIYTYNRKNNLTTRKVFKDNMCVYELNLKYNKNMIEVFKINNCGKETRKTETLYSYELI